MNHPAIDVQIASAYRYLLSRKPNNSFYNESAGASGIVKRDDIKTHGGFEPILAAIDQDSLATIAQLVSHLVSIPSAIRTDCRIIARLRLHAEWKQVFALAAFHRVVLAQ